MELCCWGQNLQHRVFPELSDPVQEKQVKTKSQTSLGSSLLQTLKAPCPCEEGSSEAISMFLRDAGGVGAPAQPWEGQQLKTQKFHSSAVLQGLKLFESWVLPHSRQHGGS